MTSGPRLRIVTRFTTSRLAVCGLVFLLLLVLCALFAAVLAPKDPNFQDLLNRLKGPSGAHWLGTDELGRDQLSRLIYGSRVSLIASVEVVAIAVGVGLPLGMIAGFLGGRIEGALTWLMDAFMSVPGLLLALTMISVLGRGLAKAMLVIGLLTIPRMFRVTRATTRDVRAEPFIEASEAIGCSTPRTLLSHVLPNVVPPLVVQIAVTAGVAVVAEATLSLLGLGVPPGTSSWGSMLTSAASNIRLAPFMIWGPGLMIMLTVLSFTLVGEGLSKALGTRRLSGSSVL